MIGKKTYASFHASHRYQQITGNTLYIFSCLGQIPANHRQHIVHLFMPCTDTSKSQATNRITFHASHKYQQIMGNREARTDTSISSATNRTSFHASHRYQQITGNKSYIAVCLAQIPANHRQQIPQPASSHASHKNQQIIVNDSYIFSCLAHRYQQIIGYIFSCLAQIPANHRLHFFMPGTDTSKS